MISYPVVLSVLHEGGYLASVPDLQINAQGATLDKALHIAQDAIVSVLTDIAAHGKRFPEPSVVRAIDADVDIDVLLQKAGYTRLDFHYMDFKGSVEYSSEDACFHGKIIGINDLVSYEGDTIEALHKDFVESVNEYIELCARIGKHPEREGDLYYKTT